MATDKRRIKKPPSDKCLSEYIRYIAAGCHPAHSDIVAIAHGFMDEQRCEVLESGYKDKFIEKVEKDLTLDLRPENENKPCFSSAQEIPPEELHNTFVGLQSKMSPKDKKALVEVLRAKNPSHDDIYRLTRDALLKYVILSKKFALNLIRVHQPSNFDAAAIEDTVSLFIKNYDIESTGDSDKDPLLKKDHCEAFFWELDRCAATLQRRVPLAILELEEKLPAGNMKKENGNGRQFELSPAMRSQLKKALKKISRHMAEVAKQEKDALRFFGLLAKDSFINTLEEYVDQGSYWDKQPSRKYLSTLSFDLEDIFSEPSFWQDLSNNLASAQGQSKTAWDPERTEALRDFCRICMIYSVPQEKNPSLSRGSDFYIVASHFLKAARQEFSATSFETSLKRAYEFVKNRESYEERDGVGV